MAKHEISATTAARSLSELLNRIEYRGEQFTIVRNGREVAELSPPTRGSATLGDLWRWLETRPLLDDEFACDLDAIRAAQPPLPDDPWA